MKTVWSDKGCPHYSCMQFAEHARFLCYLLQYCIIPTACQVVCVRASALIGPEVQTNPALRTAVDLASHPVLLTPCTVLMCWFFRQTVECFDYVVVGVRCGSREDILLLS